MAEQTIVFAQGIEMPPDILAQVQQMKPAGFTLQMLPPSCQRRGDCHSDTRSRIPAGLSSLPAGRSLYGSEASQAAPGAECRLRLRQHRRGTQGPHPYLLEWRRQFRGCGRARHHAHAGGLS